MAITQTNLDTIYSEALGGSMVAATGTITIGAGNAEEDDTVTVNGVEFTFKAAPSGAREVDIGADNDESAANLQAKLVASQAAAVLKAEYTVADNVVTVTYKVPGTAGNAFTLAKDGTNITVSGATLSGGADTGATDFAPVDANGYIAELRQDSDFEKNVLALVGVVDAILGLSANPSTSDATQLQAVRQRKALKTVLQIAASVVPTVADGSADDRAAVRQRVRDEVLLRFNGINSPLDL